MPVKCTRCGVESEVAESFANHRKSFSKIFQLLCPACSARQRLADDKFAIFTSFVWGVVGLLFIIFLPEQSIGWFLLNLFIFYLCSILTIVPHELGHALAGRAVGFRVFGIIIGVGKKLWKGKLFGFDVTVNSMPIGGLALVAPKTLEGFRAKKFITVAAGPLVNLLIALFIWAIVPAHRLSLDALDRNVAPLTIFFYANLWVLAVNLWPHKVNQSLGGVASDGKQLLTAFTLKDDAIKTAHAGYFLAESSACHYVGDVKGTEEWVQRGLALYPHDRHLLMQNGLFLMDRGRLTEARELYTRLLTWPAMTPVLRALLMNNLAYADVLMAQDDLLPEADRCSQEAMAVLSAVPEIKGTRGAVLSALGRIEEGLPLLREALQTVSSPRSRAENACHISIAEARRGNRAIAETYLTEARTLNPECKLIERAESVVRSTLSGPAMNQSPIGS
ncbi:MAG: hypothetical protein JWM68_5833 [Verrucomicrobiales bacterium]|nr:hypothetical protein [Verrucomicrobiales bacterium]